ncbi:DNA polymerase III delta prime subunit [Neorhizobium galegae]|uniref:AAA family ATPase n=1 Tax=Neorhizobium galegae TaxID=399 RepID=UPI00277EF067|nr:AAA family ATPase [Neorhizobium galegae]MDQ0133723.1 DNA polymerase III delta prime subunit [Neorhizobium galegae]
MNRAPFRDRFRNLAKDPSALLAYWGLRQSIKDCGPTVKLDDGFVIVIIPVGFRAQPYKRAAYLLLNSDAEEWGEPRTKVRLANPPKRKGSIDSPPSIFDLQGLRVVIATHINEVQKDVRFVASRIVPIPPPSTRDILATRRVLRLPLLAKEHVGALVGKTENVVIAGILKREWTADDLLALNDLDRPDGQGPSLFDLPGYHELKDWGRGIAKDVDRWRHGTLDWKHVTRGVVLSGPPGVGKTYFASALATALGFQLVCTTVGSWQSAGHLDDMINSMRRSFDDARSKRGAVLFIDEFDSVGTRPVRPTGHPNEVYWQVVVNEFLSLMNTPGEGVIVIGATNYIEWIDPAILRAGRIENHFTLTPPDAATRAEILRYHTGVSMPPESLIEIANGLEGRSPAALEELVRNARKEARDEGRELDLRDLQAQIPEKRKYTPQQLFRLGVHEAGHALISLALGYATSATIEIKESFDPTATSYAGGQTSYDLVDDHLPTDTTLLNRIAVAIAGMAAEATVFADRSLGSGGLIGSDVERATAIARRLVASYGLGKTPIFFATVDEVAGTTLPAALENEVVKILRIQYERVLGILVDQRDRLIAVAGDAAAHGSVRIERDVRGNAA